MPQQVLGPSGQLVGLDEGQRPVQVRADVLVVAHLGADGGQVAHGPGGVVLQAGGGRHLEPLLQLLPAAQVAGQQPSRADVGQGVAERLLVVQPPGQLDRPPGPGHRRLQPVGQHVELGLVAVGHGQLAAGLQGLQHGDGPDRGRLRLASVAVPPVQPRQPAQRLAQLLRVAGGLPEGHGGLTGRDRLGGQPRQVGLDREALQQLGAGRRGDPVGMGQDRPVVADGLPVGRHRRRLPGRLRRIPQHGLGVAGLAGVVHQPGHVDLPSGGAGQHLQDPAVELPAAERRQRALHRLPEQLVAEPDRLLADDQQPGRHPHLDRRRRRPRRLLHQPQLGPGRDHGDQPHDLLGVRRQPAEAGQHQLADGQGHTVAGGQHLGDQQRVPAGERAQPRGRAAGPPGQLGHGRP